MRLILRPLGGGLVLVVAGLLFALWRTEKARGPASSDSAPGAPASTAVASGPTRPPRAHAIASPANGAHLSGEPVTIASLPVGSALRHDLECLAPRPLARALARLSRTTFGIEDTAALRVDDHGGVYFVCAAAPQAEAAEVAAAPSPGEERAASAAATPISAPPIRHSRPGCANVIYLDFNGAIVSGTGWNNGEGRPASYDCLPFDTDGAPAQFSDAEQIAIVRIWERVAEDYAPFEVDVTTEEPATFTAATAHALITRPRDRNDIALPSPSAGGVAYLDVFGEAVYTMYRPAFVYFSNLSSRADFIAEAVSHEIGHNLGLSHDGLDDGSTAYYAGHGSGEISWAPIMGAGYNRHVTQWSNGAYTNANNPEDDLAILDSKLARRSDDTGDTPGAALVLPDGPAQVSANSVLHAASDADVFGFHATNGNLSVTASPYRAAVQTHGGNADLTLELLDTAGNVVATAAPTSLTTASLATTLTAAGRYYVRLSTGGAGDPLAPTPTGYTAYGALGQLTVAITRVPAAPPTVVSSPAAAACLPGGDTGFAAAFAGVPAPALRWEFRPVGSDIWTPLSNDAHHQGAAVGTLALLGVPPDFHGRQYRCVAQNGIGAPVPSAAAVLSVSYSWSSFLATYFSPAELATPAVCGGAADPDQDGVANLLEYALARHPRLREAVPALQFSLAAGSPTLAYRRARAAADISFVLEQSGDLAVWSEVASTDLQVTSAPVSATVDEIVLRVSAAGANRRFYRLRVTRE